MTFEAAAHYSIFVEDLEGDVFGMMESLGSAAKTANVIHSPTLNDIEPEILLSFHWLCSWLPSLLV
jgi:hypothetical protein